MIAMNDPRYAYRPRSDTQRTRQSIAQRRRLGIPDGHVRIYGVHVPEAKAAAIRAAAQRVAGKRGAKAATAFVQSAGEAGWRITQEQPWTAQSEAALRRYHYGGLKDDAIAERLGRTRNSIIGKRHRLKLISPPAGSSHVPASEARKMAADHLECDPRAPEAEAGLFLVSPLFIHPTPRNVSCYSGIPSHRVERYWAILLRSGLWTVAGPKDRERYTREGPDAVLSLILDALLCVGRIRHFLAPDGEDMWAAR